jgi:hypothetical protein
MCFDRAAAFRFVPTFNPLQQDQHDDEFSISEGMLHYEIAVAFAQP